MKLLKNKLAVTIIVLSVAFFGLIIYSIQNQNRDVVSSSAGAAVSPLQKIVYNANTKMKNFVDFFLNFSTIKEENEALEKKNIELEKKLVEYDKFKTENERLKEVVKFKDSNTNFDYLGCNIIGYSNGNISDGYVIDRGSSDGLKENMVVISNKGLVGQVTSVAKYTATVESIINENIAVAVMPTTTRENTGILRGYKDSKKNNLTKVTNLPLESQVKVGDVIVTSGLGGIYPKEIRVGEVVSVETDDLKVMKSAVVKPYVDFNKLEELFVIIPKNTEEIKYN